MSKRNILRQAQYEHAQAFRISWVLPDAFFRDGSVCKLPTHLSFRTSPRAFLACVCAQFSCLFHMITPFRRTLLNRLSHVSHFRFLCFRTRSLPNANGICSKHSSKSKSRLPQGFNVNVIALIGLEANHVSN